MKIRIKTDVWEDKERMIDLFRWFALLNGYAWCALALFQVAFNESWVGGLMAFVMAVPCIIIGISYKQHEAELKMRR